MTNDSADVSSGFLQSFARGLAVIRAFGSNTPSLTLSQAAALTGLTRANARRILLTLRELGYVEQDGRQFRLRPKVLDLGFSYLSSLSLGSIAQPIMEDMVLRVKEPCNLAMLDGTEVIYVGRVAAKQIVRDDLGIHIGRRFPAYTTSLGRVLLGGLSEAALDQYFKDAQLLPLTPRTITDPKKLRAVIKRDHQLGHSYVKQESGERCSIAAPVFGHTGMVAAIGIGWYAGVRNDDEFKDNLLPELLGAARDISNTLRQVR